MVNLLSMPRYSISVLSDGSTMGILCVDLYASQYISSGKTQLL
jgi:hypothetical protein